MLTKNLYLTEEVGVALLYAIKNRNIGMSMFWCKEMVDSGLEQDARKILFDAWIWFIVSINKEWFEIFENEKDIIKMCYELVTIPHRNCSLFTMLSSGIQYNLTHPPDNITQKTIKSMSIPIENYYVHCLSQHKTMSACWAIRGISNERSYELLGEMYPENKGLVLIIKRCSEGLGYVSKSQQYIVLCACIICCILDIKSKLVSEIDRHTIENLKEWSDLPDIISRRKYRIPPECLYALTSRGRMYVDNSNYKELSYCEKNMTTPYWLEQFAKMNVQIKGDGLIGTIKEDAPDDFYDCFFTGIRIPDEWSLLEQEKSHGKGLLSLSETLQIKKLYRIWFSNIQSTLLWGKDSILYGDCPLSFWELGERYTFGEITCISQLNPVKKKLIIQ